MATCKSLSAAPTCRQPEAGDTADELSFGPFRLLPQRRLLTRDCETVRLGGHAMEILIALA
jgi:DNA-binding response OmpR family regulator